MRTRKKVFFVRIVVIALLLLTTGLGVIVWWANEWLRGAGFRQSAESALSEMLDAEVTLQPLAWSGLLSEIHTEGGIARGRPTAFLKSAKVERVKLSLLPGDLLQRRLHIQGIEIGKMELLLGERVGQPATTPRTERSHSAFSALAPQELQIGPIHSRNLSLRWLQGGGGELRRVEAVLRRATDCWTLSLKNGELLLPEQPIVGIIEASLAYSGEGLQIVASELSGPSGGRCHLSGSLFPTLALEGTVEGIPITPFLNEQSAKMITGDLAGAMTFTVRENQRLRSHGAVRIDRAHLRGGTVMDQIARLTSEPGYSNMPLHEARMTFSFENERLRCKEIVIESRGLLAIHGEMTLSERFMDGEFEVGVPVSSLRRLPGSATAVFRREENGYRWTTVKVAGPIDQLENDLIGRLMTAPLAATLIGVNNTLGAGIGLVGGTTDLFLRGARTTGEGVKTLGEGSGKAAGSILNGAVGGLDLLRRGAGEVLEKTPLKR